MGNYEIGPLSIEERQKQALEEGIIKKATFLINEKESKDQLLGSGNIKINPVFVQEWKDRPFPETLDKVSNAHVSVHFISKPLRVFDSEVNQSIQKEIYVSIRSGGLVTLYILDEFENGQIKFRAMMEGQEPVSRDPFISDLEMFDKSLDLATSSDPGEAFSGE
ncbi:MAG: hypothetical protein A2152_00970 [Candidatus Levybacteria bacterium RBG_16_35_6]|nr:MAG: hypothetical protein A2152_00970 [Candidatus Levybacteria bacterium RBG_16_35_6]